MKKEEVLEKINSEKLVPVIRTSDVDEARQAVEIIGSCGINIFEITLTIPNAADLIKELSSSRYLIGAGTVLTIEQAEICIEAGAKFIVSPIFDEKIVKFCTEKNIAVMPAGLTPTEIYRAWQSGADCVKIFPFDSMGGAKYLKAIKSVFPEINLMPTGGVSLETAGELLKAGAFAVGVGSDLVDLKAIRAGETNIIAERAIRFTKIVKDAKN
jgi:2-dehydro-3-deoxyphosphogluconate aldolase / (4S)-4-hydroxy-2-oxoglutarate aldolase